MKLLKITNSTNKNKRYTAHFSDGKSTDFGLKNPVNGTFIDHKDKNKRKNYIKRHMKDLNTGDPTKPGFLSMFLLWNKETLKESIEDYKKIFSL